MSGREGAAIIMKYFGKLPGQNLQGFAEELRELDDESFFQLVQGIQNETYTY